MMTKEAFVIGSPISHSLSPAIFAFLCHRQRVADLEYKARDVSAETLSAFVNEVKANPNFIGSNVTIPHKEAILQYLDEMSTEAQAVGAANVIQKKGSSLCGYNTDVYGILQTLQGQACFVTGARVLILGAGGAARALAYALGLKGAKQIDFLNRGAERAQSLIDKMAPLFPRSQFRLLSHAAGVKDKDKTPIVLVINATPLGLTLKDELHSKAYFWDLFRNRGFTFLKNAHAFDLIYKPEKTVFLESALREGFQPISGLAMLVGQALQTWQIWFGLLEGVSSLQTDLLDYLRNQPLYLTGFMGVGKSTVGRVLAKILGRQFLDIDALIEQEAQMSISDLFQQKGEQYFRELEFKTIRKHVFQSRIVVALGGGALTYESSRDCVRKAGQLVYLSANMESLLERLANEPGQRPVLGADFSDLKIEDRRSRLMTLFKAREGAYNKLADLKVVTDHLTPEEIAQQIVQNL